MIKVLYTDDEEFLLDICKIYLERSGEMDVDGFLSVADAEEALYRTRYDAIVSDYQMPDIDGIEFLKKVRSEGNKIPFILFTGKGREEIIIEAFNSGANFYLQKGGDPSTQFAELEHHIKEGVFKKRAEDEVLVSSLKLNAAMNLVHVGFWSLDLTTYKIEFDDQSWNIYNSSIEKEVGDNVSLLDCYLRFIHPEDVRIIEEEVKNIASSRSTSASRQIGFRIVREDGQIRRVLVTYTISHDKNGRPFQAFGAIQDVTDLFETQIRLAQLNRGLVAIKEINKAILKARTEKELLDEICRIVCDKAGYRAAWIGLPEKDNIENIRPVAWAGFDDDEIDSLIISLCGHGNADGPTGEAMRTGRTISIQDLTQDPGMAAWKEAGLMHDCRSCIALPIINLTEAIGTLTLCSGTINNFTSEEVELLEEMTHDLARGMTHLRSQVKIKRAERSLKESEERYKSIFHGTAAGMSLSRLSDGTYIEVNARWLNMNGYSREQAIGFSSRDLKIWTREDDRKHLVHELLQNGTISDMEFPFRRKNGELWTSLLSAEIIRINGEDLILSTYLDITERKRTEEALAEALRKINLLSGITRHDIRNKLTVLQSNLSLIQKKNDGMSDERLQKAMAAADRILAIIDFAKEYEEIGINIPMWYNVHELVDYCSGASLIGNVKVENHVPVTFKVFADPMIRKVFSNLMDNAVRHGGKVTTIRFYTEKREGHEVLICLDDGLGVSPEMKEHLFMRGYGNDHGLGLYLSREILAITGITIKEEDAHGYGAKFVMTFPPNGIRR